MDRIEFTNIVNHKIATINAAIRSAFVGAGERLSRFAERIRAILVQTFKIINEEIRKIKPIISAAKSRYMEKYP